MVKPSIDMYELYRKINGISTAKQIKWIKANPELAQQLSGWLSIDGGTSDYQSLVTKVLRKG